MLRVGGLLALDDCDNWPGRAGSLAISKWPHLRVHAVHCTYPTTSFRRVTSAIAARCHARTISTATSCSTRQARSGSMAMRRVRKIRPDDRVWNWYQDFEAYRGSIAWLVSLCLLWSSCSRPAPQAIVSFADMQQSIDRFGASAADFADHAIKTMSAEQADILQSDEGSASRSCGCRCYRFQGRPAYATDVARSLWRARFAGDRGAKLIATFLSAPAEFKDNRDVNNGGRLLPDHYGSWAATIAGFQADLKANSGHDLYAVSVQNEPDFTAPYPSMRFTPAEMTAFIKVLGPKLAALGPRPKLMAAEVADWSHAAGFSTDTLSDPAAADFLDMIAVHQYSGVASLATTRPIWQTEMSGIRDQWDPSMTHALTTAQWVHDALTKGRASAWLYWWLIGQTGDNQGLIGYNGDVPGPPTATKRLYAVGNYSRFVRPGWLRVGVAGTSGPLSITAFRNPDATSFAIVVINNSRSASALTVNLSGLAAAASVTPWVTSASEDLAARANVAVSGQSFTSTVASRTVTTFVGSVASRQTP